MYFLFITLKILIFGIIIKKNAKLEKKINMKNDVLHVKKTYILLI